MPDLASQAIDAALGGRWQEAAALNRQLLKKDKKDIDGLNRLGKALVELSEGKTAAAVFRKVLRLDHYNPIAQKNLAATCRPAARWGKNLPAKACPRLMTDFLEEPGKTRLVSLVNLSPPATLLRQRQANEVQLVPKRHTTLVADTAGSYLGAVPDDLGHRLALLIKGGNSYCVFIKSVSKNSLVVFIRETARAKRFAHTPSFPAGGSDYFSFIREQPLPSIAASGEEGEENEASTLSSERLHADEEAE